ncbi:hypothetical protein NW768_009422 [Fusarium equiseti]|uniref:Uncharacterized protein n=1 Tax=Fusarium equiseti TaxID=61235 RepID=A0ABQ8R3D9_FUSEQ|nr:hypothetical protein NW768_009422 [Fusarium equiseti]
MPEERYVSCAIILAPVLTFLERHYSYECKATTQERPYVSRPSRSQQLRNPKLVPKLTNETLNPLEKKEGVADAELAKADAERARKREREERDDEFIESSTERHRSVSSHSVSTISTGASRSPSPGKDRAASPKVRGRSPYSDSSRGRDRDGAQSRSRSFSSNRSRSPRVEPQNKRSVSGDDRSLGTHERHNQYRSRDPLPSDRGSAHMKQSRRGSSGSRSPVDHRGRRDGGSRSPQSKGRRDERPDRSGTLHERERPAPRGGFDGRRNGRGGHHQENARERSLSPFSQRLAMTKAMKQGGR